MSIADFELVAHPVANLFPMMSGDEYGALVDDIREHGMHEPIWLHDGQIIDGRNRYRACQQLGIEPETIEWNEEGSLVSFVVSMNLHRRHLTFEQRVACAVEARELYKAEAKDRQRGGPGGILLTAPMREASGEVNEKAAKAFSVGARSVDAAAKIRRETPEVIPLLKINAVSLTEAKILAAAEPEQRAAIVQRIDAGEDVDVRREVAKANRDSLDAAAAQVIETEDVARRRRFAEVRAQYPQLNETAEEREANRERILRVASFMHALKTIFGLPPPAELIENVAPFDAEQLDRIDEAITYLTEFARLWDTNERRWALTSAAQIARVE